MKNKQPEITKLVREFFIKNKQPEITKLGYVGKQMTSPFDYKNPNYSEVFEQRANLLSKIRSDQILFQAAKVHYRENPWDFINDFGMTFEPRNIEKGLLSSIPFVVWGKQKEYLQWLYAKWKNGDRGLVEKSRDCGVTWLNVGFAVSMWCFHEGFTCGFGSRKEVLVDKKGDSKSIFEKLRFFVQNIPQDFLPEHYEERTCSAYMRIVDPHGGGSIIGEAGDQIGRGGRCSIYIVDEAAFVERQDLVDAALSQNTNCQIDVSSVNGSGNAFYKKRMRWDGTDKIFIFDWKDDPRKDQAWYKNQIETLDEVIVAQEIDRDYNASSGDSFIPAKWVNSAIDAHLKLGFPASGIKTTGFDPADIGDAKAIVNRYGVVITNAKQLKKGDITQAIPWALHEADMHRADLFIYDADGMGAPSMKLALGNMGTGRMKVCAFYGSGEIYEPEKKYGATGKKDIDIDLKTNADTFRNFRAQSATWLRDRFKKTHEAITRAEKGMLVNFDPADLISISSECEDLIQLQAELSRPKRIFSNDGKIAVESKKEMKSRGIDSPNLFDSTSMAFSRSMIEDKKESVSRINYKQHGFKDRSMGY